jgi:hypothetical protein
MKVGSVQRHCKGSYHIQKRTSIGKLQQQLLQQSVNVVSNPQITARA